MRGPGLLLILVAVGLVLWRFLQPLSVVSVHLAELDGRLPLPLSSLVGVLGVGMVLWSFRGLGGQKVATRPTLARPIGSAEGGPTGSQNLRERASRLPLEQGASLRLDEGGAPLHLVIEGAPEGRAIRAVAQLGAFLAGTPTPNRVRISFVGCPKPVTPWHHQVARVLGEHLSRGSFKVVPQGDLVDVLFFEPQPGWGSALVLAVLLWAGGPEARAAEVEALVNLGIGPLIGSLGTPGSGMPLSMGFGLTAEGWVDRKTLRSRKVMRRVPKEYRAMVRGMDDMHTSHFPVGLVPDQYLLFPLGNGETKSRAVTARPIEFYLGHQIKPTHRYVSLGPRMGWVEVQEGERVLQTGWLGLCVEPTWESDMKKRLGVLVSGQFTPGFGLWPNGYKPASRPFLLTSAGVKMMFRFPIHVQI